MSSTALVIMTRCPEKGKVKTRLARSIGTEETLQLYQSFLCDLAARFGHGSYALYWAYTPAESPFEATLAETLPAPIGHYLPQQGEGLGQRLHNVFLTLSKHYQRVIVIASDSPHISSQLVEDAERALYAVDVVLGPADDGGYYLIGMRSPHDVFSGIPMSTAAVLSQTISSCRRQHLAVQLLEPLFDVDELADLQRLSRLLQDHPALAPTTAACLSALMKEFV